MSLSKVDGVQVPGLQLQLVGTGGLGRYANGARRTVSLVV
jgi:hypothetical protein